MLYVFKLSNPQTFLYGRKSHSLRPTKISLRTLSDDPELSNDHFHTPTVRPGRRPNHLRQLIFVLVFAFVRGDNFTSSPQKENP